MGKLRSITELFAGRHFDREVIILCVRWYLRYKLSFRDLVEMMAERGLHLAHTTILRWVRRYAPEFVKHWDRFEGPLVFPGGWTRPTSRYVASGPIYTGRWTRLGIRLTSGSAADGMWPPQRPSSGRQSGV